jgi:hypothetical protein
MLKHFGRIALDSIVNRWSDSHPSNPRFLASEVAATLRSMAPLAHPLGSRDAGIYHDGQAGRDETVAITHGALADYFDSVSSGHAATTLSTSSGEFPVSNVLIWQHWIESVTVETVHRMGNVETLALPANSSGRVALAANDPAPAINHVPPSEQPSGSAPGYLKMYQAKLRKEGEYSAAEDLDAERVARQRSDREVVEHRAQRAIDSAQIAQLLEENEQLRRNENNAIRAKRESEDELILIEEMLEAFMLQIEFLRSDNPLSPPEQREMFECWRYLTDDNTREPVTAMGKGMEPLCEDWFKSRGENVTAKKLSRFATALNSSSRKMGGVVPAPTTKKGYPLSKP